MFDNDYYCIIMMHKSLRTGHAWRAVYFMAGRRETQKMVKWLENEDKKEADIFKTTIFWKKLSTPEKEVYLRNLFLGVPPIVQGSLINYYL